MLKGYFSLIREAFINLLELLLLYDPQTSAMRAKVADFHWNLLSFLALPKTDRLTYPDRKVCVRKSDHVLGLLGLRYLQLITCDMITIWNTLAFER